MMRKEKTQNRTWNWRKTDTHSPHSMQGGTTASQAEGKTGKWEAFRAVCLALRAVLAAAITEGTGGGGDGEGASKQTVKEGSRVQKERGSGKAQEEARGNNIQGLARLS
jgi:hypothetical protein